MKRAGMFFVMLVLVLHVFTSASYCESAQVRRFAEVKITLDERFTLADAEALPMAPGSKVEALEDGKAVKVQIPAAKAQRLLADSVNIEVERNFILLERTDQITNSDGRTTNAGSCSGPHHYAENDDDYIIEDNQYWWYSYMDLSYIPPDYTVTCIDVYYIIEPSWSWVDIGLTEESLSIYILDTGIWGGGGTIYGSKEGITEFNGTQLGQVWYLLAYEDNADGSGYIDYWWIKLYYEDSGGYCSTSGGCYEHISRVKIGSIDNSSGCDGYADYTYLSMDIEFGGAHLLTVTSTNGYPTDECGVWVDWNQDEDFDDEYETISVAGNPGPGPYTAFVGPPNPQPAGPTRMRIRITDTAVDPLDINPCGFTEYGEVEDYTINVIGEPTSIRLGGHVRTSWGDPMQDIEVSASTGENDTTDATGYYEFEVPSPYFGSVGVTSVLEHWSFSDPYLFINKTNDDLNVDFTGYYSGPTEITIRGYIETTAGAGIQNVLLQASTGQQTYSGTGGYYELVVSEGSPLPPPWTGTVTPSKDYWQFSPTSRGYSAIASDVNDANYVGTYTADPTPTITGYVKTAEGQPVKGVQIAADSLGGSAMTDADGFYELTLFGDALAVPRPYDGNVTPFKTDWSFSPPNNVYTGLAFDIHDQNYTASYIGAGCDNGWIEQWVTRYNGDDVDYFMDQIKDMAIDYAGNIYITGWSGNYLTKYDYALIKYDPNGELLWAARYDQSPGEDEMAEALAIDISGNVYVTGHTEANDIYGNYDNCTTLRYPPDSSIPNWIAIYDGPDHRADAGVDITTDAEGFVYVLCNSYDTSSRNDIVTIKYSPDSNIPVWTARYNGPSNDDDDPEAIAVDRYGNVYVAGSSYSSTNRDDFVTIKYSPEGTQLWVKNYNGSLNEWDFPKDITSDRFGNVYVTGNTQEVSTGQTATTIKYDADGNELWIAKFSAGIEDYAEAMILDGQGNLYVAGGGGPSSNSDFLLIKYNTDSNQPVWISTYDGPEGLIDSVADVAADRFGNIYLTGWSNLTPGYPPTGADFMTVKYSPDSNQPLWSAVYSGPPGSLEAAQRVAVDDAGDVIVGGSNEAMVIVKYSQCCDLGDINCDRTVDYDDLGYLCGEWLMEKCYFDIAPDEGDGFVDFLDYSVFADSWLTEMGQRGFNPVCDVSPQGGDGKVDQQDANVLMDEWLKAGWYYLDADIAPSDEPDGAVNFLDYATLCANWLTQINP